MSFLLETEEGIFAIGLPTIKDMESWVEELGGVCNIKWIALFGMEYERKVAAYLLEKNDQITVIAGMEPLFYLKQVLKVPFKSIEIRNKRTLILGGRKLEFCIKTEKGKGTSLYIVDESGQRFFPTEQRAEDRVSDVKLSTETISKKSIAVLCDNKGFIRELAERVEAGIGESMEVELLHIDLEDSTITEAVNVARRADFLLFAICEEKKDVPKTVWDIITSLKRQELAGKQVAVLGNGKLDGSFLESFLERLHWLGADLNTGNHILQGMPEERSLKAAYEYGFDLSCVVRRMPNPRKSKLVRCLVCGEIFDASLGICPVCGVGLEQCEAVEEEASIYQKDTEQNYLIIGGGIAALSAAEAIRKRDKTGNIHIFSAEKELPINRPMLTKDFGLVAKGEEGLLVHEADWYTEKNITMHLHSRVLSIDTVKKMIQTSEGKAYFYDKLIYAAGAECFVPPFKGSEKNGVLTIRHLEDALEMMEHMKHAKRAVVIGGGVLGLEAASEIMRQGIKVTVLEATPQIIGRQIDTASAMVIKERMQSMGVECYENVSIEEIEGENQVSGVRLADGRVFEADFVLVSCGNRGNVELAKNAGIQIERGIVVDAKMQTSQTDIYACGDCAQYDGVNYQLWQEATEQGKVAGANAAGEAVLYKKQNLGLSFEGFHTSLYALGEVGKKEEIPYKLVTIDNQVNNSKETYWFYANRLQGAVVINRPDKISKVGQWVTSHELQENIF